MQFLLKRFSFSDRTSRSEYWLSSVMSLVVPVIAFLLLTAILFALSRQLHGDPLQVMLYSVDGIEDELSEEQKRLVGKQLGLDAPLVLQYLRWTKVAFFEGSFSKWITTGLPVSLLQVPEEFIDNYNVKAQNISLVSQYLLGAIWLLLVLLTLVFWSAVVVRRLRDVRASPWNLIWFFIPGSKPFRLANSRHAKRR